MRSRRRPPILWGMTGAKAAIMIRALNKTIADRHRDSSEEAYWAAVKARDRSFDGTFYYSVATTGVYCRPSCAARQANRENVAFHATAAEAEAAGFRPCKRCKPDQPSLHARYATTVAEACRTIEAADEPPTLHALAERAGLSPFHFHRIFKTIAGVTPKAYGNAHRGKRLRDTLAKAGPSPRPCMMRGSIPAGASTPTHHTCSA